MLQTYVNNDIYNTYCLIHNTSPLQQTNTFPWIPRIPRKIHGLSAALNGRINSQISLEMFI